MAAEFTPGQRVGDYEILSVLGAGGMGKVYKVRNTISDRVEAMKILLPDLSSNQSLADRFLREIRLLATLSHPNITAFRTALTYDNQLVMIMEFVEGETLSNRISRAPISTSEAVHYADQVLSALSYAHHQNIIHRDIKPANMMLTPQGLVKLMDFGIARSSSDGVLTSTGTTLGSLNYMPPEQVRGESADPRSDLYSFGVSLYELLTGKLPFQGDSQYSLMTAQLNGVPVAPITLRSDLPPALNEIILMAMAKDPAARFQSADAFRAALKAVPVAPLPAASANGTTLVETQLPRPVSTVSIPPRALTPGTAQAAQPSRSGRGVWLALGSVLGVGVLIAAGTYLPSRFGAHADPNKPGLPSEGVGGPAPSTPPAALQSEPGRAIETPGKATPGTREVKAPAAPGSGSAKVVGEVATGETGSGSGGSENDSPPSRGEEAARRPETPVPPSGPSPEELAKWEDEADKLKVRAATAAQTLEALRQQQIASGYNLRADIASAQERLQIYLAKGGAALKSQDVASTKRYFDLAESELGKLEKFLNH